MGVLTLMSIDTILSACCENDLLVELESLFLGDETARSMFVSLEIFEAVKPPFPDTIDGERRGEFRGWLDNFLEGAEISVAEDPDNKPPETMLARVHPVDAEFWSIRVTDPTETPGIRSLGGFAGTDMFVALTWERREDMIDFDGNVEDVRQAWQTLFADEMPFFGDDLDDYLSNSFTV
jgi:hypothetical protein